ncbi:alpha/beta fold hydrolase [Piscinibacter sakaiensis]|uniref:Putative hydrolase n=1 Tax=Piscinibacter sakaiensis TaxID=1547922 RepID=A0A0K8NZD6_PISS1|nr:alpha/beta hydrolase [Piscinibacter sakaiensis]GAP35746.1 putative hydrolase [Piscinibacter sakaiensis]
MPLPIVFSHGNGFPAGTYRRLFERWRAAGHAVHAVDKFGHDPAYPVTSNWPRLRDQLIHFIEREVGGPVLLVGHSLGGLLSLLAACRRPELAAGLVMLDSPVVTGWRAHGVRMAKATGLIGRVSPGKVSRRRRHEWAHRDEVLPHFAAKPGFARWDPRVLQDYVEAGFELHGEGARLAFRREVETRIYDTLPHHFATLLRRHPPACPVAFLAGTRSSEMRQGGFASSRALAGERFEWIEGSHLFPMERPDETAERVLALLARMDAGRRAPPAASARPAAAPPL